MSRWDGLFSRRKRMMENLDQDIRDFIERETQDNIERGMPPDEARYAALRKFGNATRVKEETREVWSFVWLEQFWQDVFFGLRTLRKSPGFTAVAVLTLALGIGANAAMFSVVNAVLLRPLPYRNPDQIVQLWATSGKWGGSHWQVAPGDVADIQSRSHAFERVAPYRDWATNLTGGGEAERVPTARVSADFFPVFGVAPFAGRTFTADEEREGHDRSAIVSHAMWQQRFGSDPALIGKSILLDGQSFTVVGIMPAAFRFPGADAELARIWLPLVFESKEVHSRNAHNVMVVARLKPSASLRQAQSEVQAIAQNLAKQYPDTNAGWGLQLNSLHDDLAGQVRPTLLLLLGAVGVVLLIACGNVSNLMIVRGVGRQREMAVRAALGAGRSRLVLQLLAESFLIALGGGALGVLLAFWANAVLRSIGPRDIPRLASSGIDAWVLVFNLLITVSAGAFFGLLPAFQLSRVDLNSTLKDSSGGGATAHELLGRLRVRSVLVVAQVALSVVLLAGATLLLRSLWRLTSVDLGINPENVLTMQILLPNLKYRESYRQREFFEQTLDRIGALPGVVAAAVSNMGVLRGDMRNTFDIQERPWADPKNPPEASMRMVSPGYFRVLGIRSLRGRVFSPSDSASAPPVAVINEAMARRFWPDDDPLGQHLAVEWGSSKSGGREVVGIVSDVRDVQPQIEPQPKMYVPYLQLPQSAMQVMVRTRVDPMKMTAAVKSQIVAVDKDQPVSSVATMAQTLSESTSEPRFRSELLSAFALLAVVLAAVGLYGVIAYSVIQQTHEIGIRMALGAEPRAVSRMVVKHGMVLTLLGIAVGLAGAFALTRLLSDMLYGVQPSDPTSFLAVFLLLAAVGLLASYIPARRATKVDPMVALRYK